jgi:Heparinase II/III-like protein/Heparinase II/III N-terminus
MSPREMAWRAGHVGTRLGGSRSTPRAHAKLLTGGPTDEISLLQAFRDDVRRPLLLDGNLAQEISYEDPAAVASLLAEVDGYIAGERRYFGYPSVNVTRDPDWNFDPIAGYHWPVTPSARIDYRRVNSDPKWIWELNRLQHLPLLAEAWLFTGEPRYAEVAFEHLDSWLDQNPVGVGIAWRSPLEAAIRAISVGVAVQGLRHSPALTADRFSRVVAMLDASARLCWRQRSRFSSANNHLIGELAGLLTVHLLFPELARPAAWSHQALESLAAEAERQILADGAGAEQAISYQLFTAELLALVVVLLRLRGDEPPAALVDALERSAGYLLGVVGSDDPQPRYGDDDDAFALRLGAEHKRSVRQHLGIIAAVTENPAAARYGEPTMAAAWIATALRTDVGEIGVGVGRHEVSTGLYAPHGGLVVLRDQRRRLTMDVGPLGYLSIAAHGHADALAVTLAVDGRDVIVDPGTASYFGNADWRVVHRGTRAHATVCVDEVDQSVSGGPFLWRRHAMTTVHAVELDEGVVDAEHDGYRRLDDPVVHRRWLLAPPNDGAAAVIDLIDGQSTHDVQVSWPLHPDLDVMPTRDGHLVSRDDVPVLQLSYAGTAPIDIESVRADDESHLGWWSDRLETKTPTWLLGVRSHVLTPVAVLTVLCTGEVGTVTSPRIHSVGEHLVASWTEDGRRRVFVIDTALAGAVRQKSSDPAVTTVRNS